MENELAEKSVENEQLSKDNSVQIVEFVLHGQFFGIDIRNVVEIQHIPGITEVFHCPEFVVGVVNIRGNIIALLDIGLFFELGTTKLNDDSKMVILQHDEKDAGLVADRMNGAKWIKNDKIQSPPPTVAGISSRWLKGVVQKEEGPLMILNIKAIFSSEEIEEL